MGFALATIDGSTDLSYGLGNLWTNARSHKTKNEFVWVNWKNPDWYFDGLKLPQQIAARFYI